MGGELTGIKKARAAEEGGWECQALVRCTRGDKERKRGSWTHMEYQLITRS